MQVDEKLLKLLKEGDEIELSVDVYGQSIQFKGIFSKIENQNVLFQNRSDNKEIRFPLEKIVTIDIAGQKALSSKILCEGTNSNQKTENISDNRRYIGEVILENRKEKSDQTLETISEYYCQENSYEFESSFSLYLNKLEAIIDYYDSDLFGISLHSELCFIRFNKFFDKSNLRLYEVTKKDVLDKLERIEYVDNIVCKNTLSNIIAIIVRSYDTLSEALKNPERFDKSAITRKECIVCLLKLLDAYCQYHIIYIVNISRGTVYAQNISAEKFLKNFEFINECLEKIVSCTLLDYINTHTEEFNSLLVVLKLQKYLRTLSYLDLTIASTLFENIYINFAETDDNEIHVNEISIKNLPAAYSCLSVVYKKGADNNCKLVIPIAEPNWKKCKCYYNRLFGAIADLSDLYDSIKFNIRENALDGSFYNVYEILYNDSVSATVCFEIMYQRYWLIYSNLKIKMLSIFDTMAEIFGKHNFSIVDLYQFNNLVNELFDFLQNDNIRLFFTEFSNLDKLTFQLDIIRQITDIMNASDFATLDNLYVSSYKSRSVYPLFFDDPLYSFAQFYLNYINNSFYSDKFSSFWYKELSPDTDSLIENISSSYNAVTNKVFIPLVFKSFHKFQLPDFDFFSVHVDNKPDVDVTLRKKIIHRSETNYLFIMISFIPKVVSTLKADLRLKISFFFHFNLKTKYDFLRHEYSFLGGVRTSPFNLSISFADFHTIHNEFQSYRNGSVVKNKSMFFGRDRDIETILEGLRSPSGRMVTNSCYCIYGQTRSGKSSLLYHLKQRLLQDNRNIIVDLGDIGSISNFELGFKRNILDEIADCIELDHPELFDLLSESGFEPSFSDADFIKDPAFYFDQYFRKLSRLIRRKAPECQIIILIDEFSYIFDWMKIGKTSPDFMRFWKAFIQNYDVCAVIVGQDHMMKFINDPRFTNSFGAIKTLEVNYLSATDAAMLVQQPLSPEVCGEAGCNITPECVNFLVEITSGSAYLLMNLCADFVEYLNELYCNHPVLTHAVDFVFSHLDQFEERIFEPLYNDKIELDSETAISQNKRILQTLAHNSEGNGFADLRQINFSAEDMKKLQTLKERNVVEIKNSECRIKVWLYAEWLRKMSGETC